MFCLYGKRINAYILVQIRTDQRIYLIWRIIWFNIKMDFQKPKQYIYTYILLIKMNISMDFSSLFVYVSTKTEVSVIAYTKITHACHVISLR